MKLKHFLVVALLAVTAVTTTAQSLGPITNDEAVRTGKLANGLTYYVRHNDYPEHRVNFYIAQRVGSLQEEESQRGLAHFLEHMCFNGTENFPGNGVIDYTRGLGVEFGRDLNAYTSIAETVYNINDVPSTRQSALDSCLLILKDWSNGLLLEDEEIDKERGVIHEEWRLRRSASQRMLENCLEQLYPGSKYGLRMPIGLMSVVDGFKYNELRDYYHKWYRPDNQAIVVVGDVDVDYTEAKIKEMFSGIPAAAPDAAQVVDVEVPDNNEAIVIVEKDKEQQYNIVNVFFKHDVFPKEMKSDMSYMLMDYAKSMLGQMLNARLSEKAQEADCPFMQASGDDGAYLFANTKDAFSLSALPKEGQTEAALEAVVTEAMRAAKYGFTQSEYLRARDEYMSRLERTYNERDKISNDQFARDYYRHYLDNEPYPSIETTYQLMQMIAPQIPVDLINQMLPELISQSDTNMVVLSFNTEKDGAVYPTAEGLKAAVDRARNAEITPYVDNVKDEPLLKNLPKKGSIKKETTNDKFGYKELTLSNGAKVILKQTDYNKNEILMLAESRGGSSLYGEKDWANTQLLGAITASSGLGEFSNTELEKALAGKQASVSLDVNEYYEQVSGHSTVKDLETMFQLTYLNFTDIRRDDKAYNTLMSQLNTMLKNKDLQPEGVFSDSVSVSWGNHSWRNRPFNVEALSEVDYDRVLQIAKERTANAADFTFYFVGNFDEAIIRPLIEQYIASLPAKKGEKENYVNVMERPHGVVMNHFTRAMETPKANSYIFWFDDKLPYSQENSVKARMLGQILDKIYLQKIREDASAAYSASAMGFASEAGDRATTAVIGVCPMKPDMAETALNIMREEMVNAGTTVDEASLADIKKVMLKDHETQLRENRYWLNIISTYVDRGEDRCSNYEAIVNAQTPATIAAFARQLVAAGNRLEVVMLPADLTDK